MYDGASYDEAGIELNDTFGYLDPSSFTLSTTTLPYELYDGLENSKESIMNLYCSCMSDMLNWLDSLFEYDNIDLTLADLGFTSYSP